MEFPKKYEPSDFEEKWKSQWQESGIYSWDPSRGRDETFVVDTPPPTVSGSLHVGHLFSYSHQDFIVRYQRMRGKNIFFPIGWDDNGLPTERRVQNLFNVKCDPSLPYDPSVSPARVTGKAKGMQTPISRRRFIELCDEVVVEDEAAFKNLWTRLGMSYDWDQEYATINEHCRRLSQYSFIELHKKGEVYQSERPVMWDVDFQTAIAQAELEDREKPSAFHYWNFGVEGSEDKLVIATTRPELLPACVAVVVHPEDERYKKYVGKNAITPLFGVPVPIFTDDRADPEKGTGVVMVCTFGDQTDVEWWREYELPTRQVLDKNGHLRPITFGEAGWESVDPVRANEVYAKISGAYVKKAQRIVVEEAEAAGDVVARPKEEIVHTVKFYEKGERPVELVPTRQWYTRIMDKKEALLAQGRKIAWHPPFMIKRYEHWVEGLNQDWCMSRQRYFGVPIPAWYPIDKKGEVEYDKPILPVTEQLPVDPLSDAPEGYRNKQRGEPGGFTGDPDVFDTWATSSLTPQIASEWIDNMEKHKKLFPMDIRPQAHEIIRTWAFYTIVKAYLHDNEIPWKDVVLSGWILDPDRKKMSKSTGNVVTPEPLIDEFGADAVRYWPARARLGVDTAYDEQIFKVGRRLCTKIFNASKFVIDRFAEIDREELGPEKVTEQTDRAIVAELRPLIEGATKAFDAFDYAKALSLVEEYFFSTFCDNFIELAKPRTYDETLTPGRYSACATLRIVHRALIRMFAPFLPYITEEVWHWAYQHDEGMAHSVHQSPWPTLDELGGIPAPECGETYSTMVVVLEAIRRAKTDAKISIAAPVKRVTVTAHPDACTALDHTVIDITRMLHINEFDLDDDPDAGELKVEVDVGSAGSV